MLPGVIGGVVGAGLTLGFDDSGGVCGAWYARLWYETLSLKEREALDERAALANPGSGRRDADNRAVEALEDPTSLVELKLIGEISVAFGVLSISSSTVGGFMALVLASRFRFLASALTSNLFIAFSCPSVGSLYHE